MFAQRAIPPGWVDSARVAFDNVFFARQPPGEVFDVIIDPAHEAAWFPDFESADWTTPPPHGRGSRRDYRLSYLRLDEHFLIWDRGRHLQFEVLATSLPLTRRFLEDYRFTPTPDGGTRVNWRVCFEPTVVSWWFQPALRPFFAHIFRQATRQVEAYLADLAQGKRPGPGGLI